MTRSFLSIAKSMFLITSLLALVSCKKSTDLSEGKHVWGNTTTQLPGFKYGGCLSKTPTHPRSEKYVREIMNHMTSSNPHTFKRGSELDPSKFCVLVNMSDSFANAEAHIENRTITIYTGLILTAESVNEIAQIIGHELAHITMQHREIQHPEYKPTAKYKELRKIFDKAYVPGLEGRYSATHKSWHNCLETLSDTQRRSGYNSFNTYLSETQCIYINDPQNCRHKLSDKKMLVSKFIENAPRQCQAQAKNLAEIYVPYYKAYGAATKREVSAMIDELQKEMEKDPNLDWSDVVSWREVEADEVGGEFYYRSGFSKDAIDDFFAMRAVQSLSYSPSKISGEECLRVAKDKSLKELDEILHSKDLKGRAVHPSPCWRVIHFAREKELHKTDLERIRPASPNMSYLEKLRQDAISEIKSK